VNLCTSKSHCIPQPDTSQWFLLTYIQIDEGGKLES
jgi:hypothetical protein